MQKIDRRTVRGSELGIAVKVRPGRLTQVPHLGLHILLPHPLLPPPHLLLLLLLLSRRRCLIGSRLGEEEHL